MLHQTYANYTLACRTPQDLSTFCNERRTVGDWEKIYCGRYVSLENLKLDDNILEVEKYGKEHPLTEKKKSRSLYTIVRRCDGFAVTCEEPSPSEHEDKGMAQNEAV